MSKNKTLLLLLILVLLLTGCRGYTDASVKIPAGWTEYQCGPLSFQFEAGWRESDVASMQEGLEIGAGIFAGAATAKVLNAWQSQVREQGTVDYLLITCYTMDKTITASDLEDVMDDLNGMARTIKNQAGLVTEVEQNARIRHYGSVDALTICYELQGEEAGSMIQLALVPKDKYCFQIAYCDFTTMMDDTTLEAILSSLTIEMEN